MALCAVLSNSSRARALDDFELEGGARVGSGLNLSQGGPNPLGLGMGARAGLALPHLYGGVTFLYYLGGSETFGGPGAMAPTAYTEHFMLYGVEAGPSVDLGRLRLRALMGFGNTCFSVDAFSKSAIYFEPGVTALVHFGAFFTGADAGVLVLPSFETPYAGSGLESLFTFHAQAGASF